MSALPYLLPIFRAVDASGTPLPFALLYTYAAGATTPLTTYQDAAGTIPNSNPVICDANGFAVVFLTAGVAYKFSLTDQYGNIQPKYPQDNLVGGATGPKGDSGAVWRDASGIPVDSVGANGDYFLDDSTGNIYRRSSGSYSIVANIKGPKGDTGAVGAAGFITFSLTSSPVGVASVALTHMGLGSTIGFTPAVSTRVLIHFQATASNNTAGDGVQMQIIYGTGAAPANGIAAPVAGSSRVGGATTPVIAEMVSAAANDKHSLSIDFIVQGLTVGTTYWFDFAINNVTGGIASITRPSCSILEV